MQLRHTLETEAVSAAERAAGTLPGARNVAVAFADLVGFTRLGEAVPPEELENLASRLSNLAHDVVSPPVRFIKTIGDAVMLVSTDPVALLRTALELLDGRGEVRRLSATAGWPRIRLAPSAAQATGSAAR